ncbi:immunoglobulin-binding protein 1-like [Sycon ciliatum]|uniref:immunoglobulin-binding protein 1-like n=1 Tax=Sycon ciliatum TaxID=27933 RepID=UPI0031F680BD|eukprot:scpid77551/ scgid23706/ Immunoglobulin-binding protein 1; B-cell signal transduction molecule alpha 4; CD79a-binding protein 1; Renal carcinoma antigen NY-REN-16
MAEKIDDSISLPVVFNTACRLHTELEEYQGSSAEEKYQQNVQNIIDGFERATRLVNSLGLFSRNEQLEDVSTPSMKYLMCPAYLMDATLKVSGIDKRLENVRTAKVYAQDFLTRCKDYGITTESLDRDGSMELSAVASSGQPSSNSSTAAARMEAMAAQRRAVLEQHRQKKLLQERVQELAKRISEDGDSVDDELERDYSKTLMRYWINRVNVDLRTVDQELEILAHREKMMQQQGGNGAAAAAAAAKSAPPAERRPFKPVVITRDKIKAGVFGAGYPSLPTMTMEEFYQKECEPIVREYDDKKEVERIQADRIKRGLEEDPAEAPEHDSGDDHDDEEKLRRQRAKDDWKDDHRRGYGNRHNRS